MSYLTIKEITKMCRVQKRLHELHLLGRKRQREKRWNQSDLFRWYKGDKYGFLLQTHWLSGLFSRLCWQNYLGISWFWSDQQDSTSHFCGVWCLCLTVEMSVFPLDSSVLLCRLLIWSKVEYRQFLAPPMNYNM